ncbi:MAG: hypothetical protein H7832_00110 [Magnetococcus sp. DMHC-6]
MNQRHYRIIVVIAPLPSGTKAVLQAASMIRKMQARNILWITLVEENMGLGFESSHVPFMTPGEWLRRTEKDLRDKLDQLLTPLNLLVNWQFQMIPGPYNQALTTLSQDWGADLILATQNDIKKMSRHDGMMWFQTPIPFSCAIQPLPQPKKSGLTEWRANQGWIWTQQLIKKIESMTI